MASVRRLPARTTAEGAAGAQLTSLHTKGDYAYRLVRDQIITGELPSGAIVQQRELAARLGISTTPLREALRRLDGEGLIDLDAHRNARVTELRAEEARDLLELRRSLDPLAAALAAERRSTSDLREIYAALRDLAPLPVEATLEQLFTHRRFHRAIYRASHNELLIETLDGLWDKADRYRMLALQTDRGQEARDIKAREHEQLAQLIAAGDADSARAVMLAHIDTSLAVTAAQRLRTRDEALR
jgi:DNA-binding GntR family transcriptional regulator